MVCATIIITALRPPFHGPDQGLEFMRLFQSTNSQLMAFIFTAARGCVYIDDHQNTRDAQAFVSGGFNNVTVGDLVEGDGFAVLSLITHAQTPAALAFIFDEADAIPSNGDMACVYLPTDLLRQETGC
mmetsp:Transcript_28406/g.40188  ORF Transcript_28406/g.40188 Transcript_28406/m.40188 type:complete len:128 (+) Transcript_28406:262-645(+)